MRHALWSLFVPSQTVGSEVIFFDLMNHADRDITVSSVVAIRDASVAATGLVSVQMFLTRTSSVGIGGTDAVEGGGSFVACTFTRVQQVALPSGVTARLTPSSSGGGGVICERQIIPEETLVQPPVEFLDTLLTVPEGTGIRVQQGSIASVGKVGFQCLFY
jgi:hypothetical protein